MVFIAAHKVKNLNWPEANQLAIYKRDWNVELTMRTNPAKLFGQGLDSWRPDYNSSARIV